MSSPPRVLFVNQGALGSPVGGHLATEAALRLGLAGRDDVVASFARLDPWTVVERAATLPVPGLARVDLDLAELRWLVTEGRRGRRVLAREVAATGPDVVHVNSHTASLLSVGLMRRIPFLLAVDVPVLEWRLMAPARAVRRGSRASLKPALALERRALDAAALIVGYSEWAAAAVSRAAPRARTTALHPGLDVERFTPGTRTARDRRRVLFVGGNLRRKGLPELLSALAPDLGHGVELDVVTAEPMAPRPGVRVHHLAGSDPALVALYQQADVFCLPTAGDASPWVVLEAMACGTPVVGTTVGAIPEMVGTGRDAAGLLVPPRDPTQLREAVHRLLDDDVRRAAMGAAGRRRVEAGYDARRQAARLLTLVETVREKSRQRNAAGSHPRRVGAPG